MLNYLRSRSGTTGGGGHVVSALDRRGVRGPGGGSEPRQRRRSAHVRHPVTLADVCLVPQMFNARRLKCNARAFSHLAGNLRASAKRCRRSPAQRQVRSPTRADIFAPVMEDLPGAEEAAPALSVISTVVVDALALSPRFLRQSHGRGGPVARRGLRQHADQGTRATVIAAPRERGFAPEAAAFWQQVEAGSAAPAARP